MAEGGVVTSGMKLGPLDGAFEITADARGRRTLQLGFRKSPTVLHATGSSHSLEREPPGGGIF